MIGLKQSDYPVQISLFEQEAVAVQNTNTTSTFIDNMKLPIHRWFRYSAGFSAKWVEKTVFEFLEERSVTPNSATDFVVLDPFAGSGTTMLAADQVGIAGIGFESHPLISKIASTKLLWNTDVKSFREYAIKILTVAKKISRDLDDYPAIIHRCYGIENLTDIDRIKHALIQSCNDSNEYKLSWLAFLSILRSTSHAGTAQWQYVLPNKSKIKVLNVFDAYSKQIELMCDDILAFSSTVTETKTKSSIFQHDARLPLDALKNKIDLIITSPPYANNYDYADATRLELCVLGEINGWSDLQNTVRSSLIRSCTQHVSKEKRQTFDFLDEPTLNPIREEIYSVCKKLDEVKEYHGGKKNYHTMIALYFLDLSIVWQNLRILCKRNSDVCFVVGDSAPYGVYVPVDEWLGKLAIASGFDSYKFVKTRDRNVKWRNRKHDIPLKEGQLWVKG
ncbi:MAG: site-specific DNA-methyltransferase [Oscillospiraceae bacterium]|nr:site-specific DNA-methyltransferase [Oscillospiraceae bacterium]